LQWRCSAGHTWSATPNQVQKGHWCPFCARVARLSLPRLQRIAAEKGGRCVSSVYINSSGLLEWECAAGHRWRTRASAIRAGHWCPKCAHNETLRLEEMHQLAKTRGGMCLSRTYKNASTPLLWVCRSGHRWRACAASVKPGLRRKGSWCGQCYKARRRFHGRRSIEAMRAMAASREGSCISTEYFGSKVKLIWECKKGHRWQSAPATVAAGSWCPVCARNQRLTLRLFQELAASRGGTCLSLAYVNERIPLHWRCADGHEWKTAPAKVKRGSWCAICAHRMRRRERTVRQITDTRKASEGDAERRTIRIRPRFKVGVEHVAR